MSPIAQTIANWTETACYYLASWFGVHDWIITLNKALLIIISLVDWFGYAVVNLAKAITGSFFFWL